MVQRLEAYLVLGCTGSATPKGFVSCHGIENPIIDLAKIEEQDYEPLIDFLDNACDLFSAPMNDYNKCVNTLSYLYKNHNAYDKDMLHSIQHFLQMHKLCGVWLTLILKEDFYNE